MRCANIALLKNNFKKEGYKLRNVKILILCSTFVQGISRALAFGSLQSCFISAKTGNEQKKWIHICLTLYIICFQSTLRLRLH